MKVKDLVAELLKYDQELPVAGGGGDGYDNEFHSAGVCTDTEGNDYLGLQFNGKFHEMKLETE